MCILINTSGGSLGKNGPPDPRGAAFRRRVMHIATDCNRLQQTATDCNRLQQTATDCNTLEPTVTHCIALQHTATDCNTQQHTATHCTRLRHTTTHCLLTSVELHSEDQPYIVLRYVDPGTIKIGGGELN